MTPAPASICWSCGTPPAGRFCGACGAEIARGTGSWQDGIYLGRSAALYRRAPEEIRALIPVLFEPFRHLNAIPAGRWRNVALVAVMGIAPLALVTLFEAVGDPFSAFRALGLYFSALWALFFAAAFRAAGIRWTLGLVAYFGTTFVGMTLLFVSLALNLELLRTPLVNVSNPAIAIPSSIAFIGVPEELTKALVLFAIWRFWGLPPLRAFVFYGLLSGLGFGIKEGVGYQLGPYATAALRHHDISGPFGFYLESVLRLTSLPFFHAVWTGIAAFLIWFAARVPSARAGLIALAVLVPATFHGLYDAFAGRLIVLALVVVATSIVLLGIYAASAAQLESYFGLPSDDDDAAEPAMAAVAAARRPTPSRPTPS